MRGSERHAVSRALGEPGAFLTDGRRLVQVVAVDGPMVTVEDCEDETLAILPAGDLVGGWRLVRREDSR